MTWLMCVNCKVEMLPGRNGVTVSLLNVGGEAIRVLHCDRWSCPECGRSVVFRPDDNGTVPVSLESTDYICRPSYRRDPYDWVYQYGESGLSDANRVKKSGLDNFPSR